MYLHQLSQDELDDRLNYYLEDEKTLDALYSGKGVPPEHPYAIHEAENLRRFHRDFEVEIMAIEGHDLSMEEQVLEG